MHAVLCDRGAQSVVARGSSEVIHTFDEVFPR
jgi:hypothetical protein